MWAPGGCRRAGEAAPGVGGWTGFAGCREVSALTRGDLGHGRLSTGLAHSHSGVQRADELPWKQAREARVKAGGDSGVWTRRVGGGGEGSH